MICGRGSRVCGAFYNFGSSVRVLSSRRTFGRALRLTIQVTGFQLKGIDEAFSS